MTTLIFVRKRKQHQSQLSVKYLSLFFQYRSQAAQSIIKGVTLAVQAPLFTFTLDSCIYIGSQMFRIGAA